MNRLTLIARLRVIANQVDEIRRADDQWGELDADKADALEMLEHLITEIRSEDEDYRFTHRPQNL